MTAANQAKDLGLQGLKQVQDMTGVSKQTLINWHNNKPKLFDIVLKGCVAEVQKEQVK